MAPEVQTGKQPTPALLFDTFNAYQRTQAIKTGIELEVFTAIGEGNTTAKAIAERCDASERGTRILCDFLTIIGFLSTGEPYAPTLNEFRNGLAESGYDEGRNVFIEYRWAEGHYERLPALATELVGRADVIVTAGGSNAATARSALVKCRASTTHTTTSTPPRLSRTVRFRRSLSAPRLRVWKPGVSTNANCRSGSLKIPVMR